MRSETSSRVRPEISSTRAETRLEGFESCCGAAEVSRRAVLTARGVTALLRRLVKCEVKDSRDLMALQRSDDFCPEMIN